MTPRSVFIIFLLALGAAARLEEQRCYFDAEKPANPEIIPCYKGPFDPSKPVACCKRGSKCMYGGTCWDRPTGVTYQYGCTDKTYKDSNCPKKCDLDRSPSKSTWAGLVYCEKTWVCHHPDNCGRDCKNPPWDPLIEPLPRVDCKDMNMKYKAMEAGSGLPIKDLLFLPESENDVLKYLAEHPTGTTKPSGTLSTATPASSRTTTQAFSKSSSESSSESSSKGPSKSSSDEPETSTSTEETTTTETDPELTKSPTRHPALPPTSHKSNGKAIGIGTAVPFLLVALGGLIVLFLKRRRHQKLPPIEEEMSDSDRGGSPFSYAAQAIGDGYPAPPSRAYGSDRSSFASTAAGTGYSGQGHRPAGSIYSDFDGSAYGPGYGYKAELPAEGVAMHAVGARGGRPSSTSELDNTTIDDRSTVNSPLGSFQSPVRSPVRSEFSGYPNRISTIDSDDGQDGAMYGPQSREGHTQDSPIYSPPTINSPPGSLQSTVRSPVRSEFSGYPNRMSTVDSDDGQDRPMYGPQSREGNAQNVPTYSPQNREGYGQDTRMYAGGYRVPRKKVNPEFTRRVGSADQESRTVGSPTSGTEAEVDDGQDSGGVGSPTSETEVSDGQDTHTVNSPMSGTEDCYGQDYRMHAISGDRMNGREGRGHDAGTYADGSRTSGKTTGPHSPSDQGTPIFELPA